MYNVVVETYLDDVRIMDSVINKVYAKRGFAERKAKELTETFVASDGQTVCRKAYCRGLLVPATEAEAIEAYRHGRSVYVDCEYGQWKLTPSWHYGSHASIEELFWRSADMVSYGYHYEGNFYIEYKA